MNNPVLRKFWAFLLSQSWHFGPDVIGFALISKINKDIWVINEVQTDCIKAYLKIRGSYYKGKVEEGEKLTWDTIKDMLEANNRSKWVVKLEGNEALKAQIINNPNIIQQLPDDSQDIDAWIAAQRAEGVGHQGLDLMRHFQSVNFNTRLFKLY